MPKMIVLFVGDEAAAEAETVAAGAKSVRFTEVDVRSAGATQTRHRTFERQDGIVYDGAVLVAANGDAARIADGVAALRACTNENTVVTIRGLAPDAARAATAAALGGIALFARGDRDTRTPGDDGARVAKVAGWVRHALGHEAEAHGHSHSHDHSHGRTHGGTHHSND